MANVPRKRHESRWQGGGRRDHHWADVCSNMLEQATREEAGNIQGNGNEMRGEGLEGTVIN